MKTVWKISLTKALVGLVAISILSGCITHKVDFEPSDKPIVININLNIQQEIRVRLDKDIEDLLADNPDVF